MRARDVRAARILEPTCGSGAFLTAAAAAYPAAEIVGVEYQRERYGPALAAVCRRTPAIRVRYADAYRFDFASVDWRGSGPLLVVGNPPWVTAAALGAGSGDVVQPPRTNPRGLRGLAARTGAANFDVAEFLLLKLARELGSTSPLHVAMLVKESVARKVVIGLHDRLARAEIVRIDARRWFGVAVDACCVLLGIGESRASEVRLAVRSGFDANAVRWFSIDDLGPAPAGKIVFRQGIKHDAADVFELRRAGDRWRNGYGDEVDVEPEFVYPLWKARALQRGEPEPSGALIVTQTALGAPTAPLQTRAPRLWGYLQRHAERLAARKSSIYRGAPPFALFGVGPYSFSPWKVAVGGFYLRPRFAVIGPQADRPPVVGDTAYFVPFAAERDARAFARVCEGAAARAALAARVVPGKRPITKAVLDGIDWAACEEAVP